jgi:RNA polymerase sigma-70 factor, ECF subfamily
MGQLLLKDSRAERATAALLCFRSQVCSRPEGRVSFAPLDGLAPGLSAHMADKLVAADEASDLVNRVIHGDERALAELFDLQRPRLRRIVNFRLDRRIYGRVGADDVLQEAYLNAAQQMKSLLRDNPPTIFIWLRQIVNQALADVHRRHLGVQKRNAKRDVSIHGGGGSTSSSEWLAFHLLGHLTSPSQAALRGELA